MTTPTIFGIDLGGTNVRLGKVEGDRVLGLRKAAIKNDRAPSVIIERLKALVGEASQEFGRPAAVGVGAPGIVDPHSGVIHRSPHFPEWVGFDLRDALAEALGCPVAIDNDANAIALGEAKLGAGRELPNFVMLTLGTGIGGGIIINGTLFRGDHGFTGEVGHQVIDRNGPSCPCGGKGCWELYASGSGMPRLVEEMDDPGRDEFLKHFNCEASSVTPAAVYTLACDGDIFASNLLKQLGHNFGVGVASLTNVLGIDQFVVGGGITAAWDLFIEATKKAIRRHTYQATAANLVLHRAQLGDNAGILGAAQLALELQG